MPLPTMHATRAAASCLRARALCPQPQKGEACVSAQSATSSDPRAPAPRAHLRSSRKSQSRRASLPSWAARLVSPPNCHLNLVA
eukprot:767663-Pleurochrysis_carterae.AAC.2